MRTYGARDHEATVTEILPRTQHFIRVRMSSPTLMDDFVYLPTCFVRFWFPDVDDPESEQQRAYTITEIDEDAGTFAVDVVLHEPSGPASAWMMKAKPGDSVSVTPLGSTHFDVPEELPAGYLVIGDSASIPAINAILETVPNEVPLEIYLEEHDPKDRSIPLASHPLARFHWVPRRGETSLAAAIEDRDWSDWKVWAAPESGSLKHLRKRLRDDFGFPKSEIHAQAYWYYGREFGKKRPKNLVDETAIETAAPDAAGTVAAQEGASTPEALVTGERREVSEESVGAYAGDLPTSASRSAATMDSKASHVASSEPAPKRGAWKAEAGGRLLAPLKPTFILAGIAQGIITLVELAPFVLLVELARLLLSGAEAAQLWTLGVWAVALMGAGVLLSTALLLWLHAVDARFAKDLRQRLLRKLSRVPLGWFDARSSGQVKQLVQDDTLALHYLVTHAVPDAVAAAVAPITVLVYLFFVDWRIALLLLLPVLIYIVAMAIMVVQSGPRTGQAMKWAERMNVEAGSYLEGQPVVRVFGGAAASTFRARLGEYIQFLEDWQRPMSGQKAFIDLVTRPATFLLLICGLGTTLIVTGAMDPVSILPFLFLGTTFGARLLGVGYGLSGLRGGLLAARRIQVTLDEGELETLVSAPSVGSSAATVGSVQDASGRRAVPGRDPSDRDASSRDASPDAPGRDASGRVEFDRVGFSYRPGVPVISDLSLSLEPGTVTALVGPSGSGKSTLAALLARFHDVASGAIRIDGHDLREFTPDELYTKVGFVFQQTQLVHGTVRENIALAVPDATDEQIEAAARAAQLHDRIQTMPQGYDTVLGPDAALSGGERQRLTIARAILADTPVLVLDEATAFADPESEYLVQQALDRLTAGRTVLVIAHRLHTITGVDQIVVLEDGRLAELGNHETLITQAGRYRQLWDAGAAATLVGASTTVGASTEPGSDTATGAAKAANAGAATDTAETLTSASGEGQIR
ncbi:ATP-binding cassette domain-containing protein [Gulosibacter chungangensis]|uniref:Mycobactin import ATP-binding/permease protein IrtA n=2 Tax=Gulosibacter chungangensis TaxID=979746 RepID=A0A7J5BGV4_9MICO|nr:ATP-binding cassette domain-containing protein [Gulosibacter chungangensis]